MTNAFSAVAAVFSAFAICGSAATAANYPTKVFDATYIVDQPVGGAVSSRMISDGKGHMRTESITAGGKVNMITDYVKLQNLTIMEAQKMAMKSKLPANSYVSNEPADMKKKSAKDLGDKAVAGHSCHGWEYSTTGGTTQVWNGNDIGWLVQSITTLPGGKKSSMTLKSFSTKVPDASLFSMDPPAGYKVMGSY